jgi:hypothetical protein
VKTKMKSMLLVAGLSLSTQAFLFAVTGLSFPAQAGIIYQDNFAGTAGTLLNGRSPNVVNTGGKTYTASTSLLLNGAGWAVSTNGTGSASIALPALTPSDTVIMTAVFRPRNTVNNWMGFGLSRDPLALSTDGTAWAYLRGGTHSNSGRVVIASGNGTTGQLYASTAAEAGFQDANPSTMKITYTVGTGNMKVELGANKVFEGLIAYGGTNNTPAPLSAIDHFSFQWSSQLASTSPTPGFLDSITVEVERNPLCHVSSSLGNDANSGQLNAPVRSLAEASLRAVPEGVILLKRGDVWTNETLDLTALVSTGTPLTVGSYDTGRRPVLSSAETGIAVTDCGGIEIKDVDVQGCTNGIAFYYSGVSNLQNVAVRDCSFLTNDTDILMDGIYDDALRPQFNVQNVNIENCVSYQSGTFLDVKPFSGVKVSANGYPVKNLTVTNCLSSMSRYSNILLRWVNGGVIDHFSGYYGNRVGGSENGLAGILLRRCYNFVIQNSEIAHFGRPIQREIDGEAIDFEGHNVSCGVSNCIIRHSAGPGVLLYQKGDLNAYNRRCWLRDNLFMYNCQYPFIPEDCEVWVNDNAFDPNGSGWIENNEFVSLPGVSFALWPSSQANHNWIIANNTALSEYDNYEWNYDYENARDGFLKEDQMRHMTFLETCDGVMTLNVDVSADPSLPALFSLDDQNHAGCLAGLNMPAATTPYVQIRLKNRTACTNLIVRWKTELDIPQYYANHFISMPISSSNTAFNAYVFDLTAHPYWTGTVHALRFEFPGSGNGAIDLDFIRVKPSSAVVIPLNPITNKWEFNQIGDVEDWVTHVRCEADTSQFFDPRTGEWCKAMILMASDSDPYVITRPLTNIVASDYSRVRIRLRNLSADSGAQFYWKKSGAAGFSAPVNFTVQRNDDRFRDYVLNLSANTNWTGTIEQLRFDFLRNDSSGVVFVDSISLEK